MCVFLSRWLHVPTFVLLLVLSGGPFPLLASSSWRLNCPWTCTASSNAMCLARDQQQASSAWPGNTPINFTVGFIGDQGITDAAADVLRLMRREGVRFVLHAGDFGYTISPTAPSQWVSQITGVFNVSDMLYAGVLGNHDVSNWNEATSQQALMQLMGSRGACDGVIGERMSCVWNGVVVAFITPGVSASQHALFVRDTFRKHRGIWRICSFHKNQRLMQVGGKADEVGWEVYDECRRAGAIVATGHEHSYSRTKEMTQFSTQAFEANSPGYITLAPQTLNQTGTTFAFVNGLGGKSIRTGNTDLMSKPWWASYLVSNMNPPADYGALICKFNLDGDAHAGLCEFKERNGTVRDSFMLRAQSSVGALPQDAYGSQWTNVNVQVSGLADAGQFESCSGQSFHLGVQGAPVGVLFRNVPLPRGFVVLKAAVQFNPHSVSSTTVGAINVSVLTGGNVTDVCSTPWAGRPWSSPVVWHTTGWQSTLDTHTTPDLSTLVQTAIADPLWQQDGDLAFMFTATNSSTRSAYNIAGNPCNTPILMVEGLLPAAVPTVSPTQASAPSPAPSQLPTMSPTASVTPAPSLQPTQAPSVAPVPSPLPTTQPSPSPTASPVASAPPTLAPSVSPTPSPTVDPRARCPAWSSVPSGATACRTTVDASSTARGLLDGVLQRTSASASNSTVQLHVAVDHDAFGAGVHDLFASQVSAFDGPDTVNPQTSGQSQGLSYTFLSFRMDAVSASGAPFVDSLNGVIELTLHGAFSQDEVVMRYSAGDSKWVEASCAPGGQLESPSMRLLTLCHLGQFALFRQLATQSHGLSSAVIAVSSFAAVLAVGCLAIVLWRSHRVRDNPYISASDKWARLKFVCCPCWQHGHRAIPSNAHVLEDEEAFFDVGSFSTAELASFGSIDSDPANDLTIHGDDEDEAQLYLTGASLGSPSDDSLMEDVPATVSSTDDVSAAM